MSQPSYFESDEYQREIAAGYDERIASFPTTEVAGVLTALGFPEIDPASITLATGGNVHATYLTPELVIKLNQDRQQPSYAANQFISKRLGGRAPIVNVLAYDNFERSAFEALVMERAPGSVLQHDIFSMTETDQQALFRQVLNVVRQFGQIAFDDFGPVGDLSRSWRTFTDCFVDGVQRELATIRREQLADESDLGRIERYIMDRVNLFDDERPVFVHTDLHMGNLVHDGPRLTAIIDCDHAQRAPAFLELATLLGFIGCPQQYVEGRPEFAQYKGRNFLHLIPTLKQELPELLTTPDLLQKLNLIYLEADLSLVAENWSTKGNEVIIRSALDRELAESGAALDRTFYGATLAGRAL